MKYTVLVGSHRAGSQSSKVGKYIQARIEKLVEGSETYLFDIGEHQLPLLLTDAAEETTVSETVTELNKQISESDGLVVITPEWNGVATPGIKNLMANINSGSAQHKPAVLVSVSGGIGGAYPIADMRAFSVKNNFINYIPEHLIVRTVKDVLNDEEFDEANHHDFLIKTRIDYTIKVLAEYAKALKQVRDSGVLDRETFANGM